MAAQSTGSPIDLLVLRGDGIGPEVVEQALGVLRAAAELGDLACTIEEAPFGGAAIDDGGAPISAATLDLAREADAVLLGAVGGPAWDDLGPAQRPEKGLLDLRLALGAFANLRPARALPGLEHASALRPEKVQGLDLMIVRELVGGVYFGQPRGLRGEPGQRSGVNTMTYTEAEIRRIGEVAFRIAAERSGRLVSADKSNVLEVMVLWRSVMNELSAEHPEVALSHMYVDNCAMQIVLDPLQFDAIVAGNLFGDILSDEAAAVTGSIGLLPSASLGEGHAIYEPVHGSAPDLVGQDRANPIAAILSVAMLLEHTAARPDLARRVEQAVTDALTRGLRTPDLSGAPDGRRTRTVGTNEMGGAIVEALRSDAAHQAAAAQERS